MFIPSPQLLTPNLVGMKNVPTALIDWSFMGGLPSGMTFTRASAGTYFDAAGVMRTAANDAPRFDYDPVTLQPRGLLMEEQRTNQVYPSNGSTVINNTLGGSVSYLSAIGVDGMSSLNIYTEDASNGHHRFETSGAFSLTKAAPYTCSVYVKPLGRTQVTMSSAWSGSWSVVFTLTGSGSVGTQTNAIGTIKYVGNGFYRISATATAVDTTGGFGLYGYNGTSTSYVGSGSTSFGFQNLQIEQASFVTSYIPTTTSSVTRGSDSLYTTNIPWFNASRGAMMAQFVASGMPPSGNGRVFDVSDGSSSNLLASWVDSSTKILAASKIDGTLYGGEDGPFFTVGSVCKAGLVYQNAANLFAVNGSSYYDGFSTAALPAGLNRLQFFNRADGTCKLNGWLQNFKYWNRALSASELQRITT